MTALIFGLLFGGVGMVYLALAKKDQDVTYLVCGVALILYPYFVANAVMIVLIGAVLIAVPIARAKGWF
jgi:hypothetical protein